MTPERRLTFVKQRQWIMPADEQTFAELRSLGISHTRLHADVFDTLLELKIKPAGIPGTVKGFDSIWTPFLERVAAAWKKIPSTKFQNTSNTIRMDSTHPGVYEEIRLSLDKIEACFDRFFTRWGTKYTFTHSESNGRHRINIDFTHGARPPVIAISPEAALGEQPIIIDLGMTRLRITNDDSGLPGAGAAKKLEVQAKCGSEYTTVYRSRFLGSAFGLTREALGFFLANGIVEPEPEPQRDPERFQRALDATAHLATSQGQRKLSHGKTGTPSSAKEDNE